MAAVNPSQTRSLQPQQQAPAYQPGRCFSLFHSKSVRHITDNALLLTTVIASIALIGGVVGILCSTYGINLGSFNALTTSISEQAIWITAIGGLALTTLCAVTIASRIRNLHNKQFSEKQVQALGIPTNHRDNMLKKKQFNYFYEAPVRGEKGHDAVYGIVVRNEDYSIGYYVFKNPDDRRAQMLELRRKGFVDFTTDFATDGYTYFKSYVESQFKAQTANLSTEKIAENEFRLIQLADDIFALRVGPIVEKTDKDGHVYYIDNCEYFKTEQAARAKAGERVDLSTLDEMIEDQKNEIVPLLFNNSFYCAEPIGDQIYFVFHRELDGTIGHSRHYGVEACNTYLATLTDATDAREAWNNCPADECPREWLEDNRDATFIADFEGTKIRRNRVLLDEFQVNGIDIYAAKKRVGDGHGETTGIRYFRTEDARDAFITSLTHVVYRNKPQFNAEVERLKAEHQIQRVLADRTRDCWTADITTPSNGKTCYIYFRNSSSSDGIGVSSSKFYSNEQLTEHLRRHNYTVVNGRYLRAENEDGVSQLVEEEGVLQYDPTWVTENHNGDAHYPNSPLGDIPPTIPNVYRTGVIYMTDDTPVYYLVANGLEKKYFRSVEDRKRFMGQTLAENSINIREVEQRVIPLRAQLISKALFARA